MPDKKPRLTPPIRSRIISAIHAGAYPHVAAQANGIPLDLFEAWLERGSQAGAREPYASFARDVHIGVALARLKAECEVFQKDPKVWLEHGPGRETDQSPGWSTAVKPAERDPNDKNPFLDPALMSLFRSLLAALVPYPEARLHVADVLLNHGASPCPPTPNPGLAYLPYPWNAPRVMRIARSSAGEDLLTPRCPVCRHPLSLRVNCRGPYYFCGCIPRTPRPQVVPPENSIDKRPCAESPG